MKIICYECKRIWLGKLFPILLICSLIYAWIWMQYVGIAGIGGTAPFSAWTYLSYCGAMLPPAVLSLLLMEANYFSERQKKADILAMASPCAAGTLLLYRLIALLGCFAVLFLLETAVYLYPCIRYFGATAVLIYPLLGLLLMLPCVLLALAAGALLGRLHGRLTSALAIILFVCGLVQTESPCDLFGSSYFSARPITLPVGADGEAAFDLDALWLVMRLVYLAAGITGILLCVCKKQKPRRVEAAI